jgi:phosphoglycolate phosphatase
LFVLNSIGFDHTRFDAAIVDLDGTMVDTLGDFAVSLNRMLATSRCRRWRPPPSRLMVGKGSEHLILSALVHVMASGGGAAASAAGAEALQARAQALFDRAWERYQHHYLAINGQHSQVYPGVVEG